MRSAIPPLRHEFPPDRRQAVDPGVEPTRCARRRQTRVNGRSEIVSEITSSSSASDSVVRRTPLAPSGRDRMSILPPSTAISDPPGRADHHRRVEPVTDPHAVEVRPSEGPALGKIDASLRWTGRGLDAQHIDPVAPVPARPRPRACRSRRRTSTSRSRAWTSPRPQDPSAARNQAARPVSRSSASWPSALPVSDSPSMRRFSAARLSADTGDRRLHPVARDAAGPSGWTQRPSTGNPATARRSGSPSARA